MTAGGAVVIGLAGLDWPTAARYAREGHMPALARLLGQGTHGVVGGAMATNSLAAWTSLATGVPPHRHRVWRASEPWAGGLRPVGRASWRAPALWQRLEAAGFSTGSVAWPAIRPGADWQGVHMDDELLESSAMRPEDWAVPLRAAPPGARAALRDRRVHVADITARMLVALAPELARIDQSRDATLPVLAMAMAQASTAQSAATWLLQTAPPDAVFLHQPWLAQIRGAFEGPVEAMHAALLPGAWRLLDAMLDHLLRIAPIEALLLLVSPGWGRQPGVMIARGPGVAAGAAVTGLSGLDLAPTLLGRFGLVAEDLPGVAHSALGARPGRAPAPAVDAPPRVDDDAGLLAQARAWGFSPPTPVPPRWRAEVLGELALDALRGEPGAAARLALEALAIDGDCLPALRAAAAVATTVGDLDTLGGLAEALRRAAPQRAWGDLAEAARQLGAGRPTVAAERLRAAEGDLDRDVRFTTALLWIAAGRPDRAERVLRAIAAGGGDARARIALAGLAIDRRDFLAAEALLGQTMRADPTDPSVYLTWARLCALTARPAQARWMQTLAARFGGGAAPVRPG